ncbi:hypothetical protein [Corynebacterium mayonis]|uniref:hypothetical protein n=1 Tax=Corynebacterium mayonis TaxID=3062461 RepID=UPI0031407754
MPGFFIGAICAAILFSVAARNKTAPDDSFVAALRLACDDIRDITGAYDTMRFGLTDEAIADRTLRYPELVNEHSLIPAIEEFQLRVVSAQRFISRIDAQLENGELDYEQVRRLAAIADQRATELQVSWDDARRAARQLRGGN